MVESHGRARVSGMGDVMTVPAARDAAIVQSADGLPLCVLEGSKREESGQERSGWEQRIGHGWV